MKNIMVIPILTVVLFFVSRFVEMKYMTKEPENKQPFALKFMVRDAIMVFVASLTSSYLFFHFNLTLDDFMNVITDTNIGNPENMIGTPAQIFTDNPQF